MDNKFEIDTSVQSHCIANFLKIIITKKIIKVLKQCHKNVFEGNNKKTIEKKNRDFVDITAFYE